MKKKKKGSSKLYSMFFSGWQGKLFSLLIAVGIYFYYQSAIHSEISFTLPLKTDGVKNTIVRFLDKREVLLHLKGRNEDLENLRNSDFEAYVQLSPGRAGSQELPVLYRLSSSDLQLLGKLQVRVEPSSVRVSVENRFEKELSVKISIDGYPETGYNLGAYRVDPQIISVTGPQSLLEKLDSVSTQVIDITGRSASFQQVARLQFSSALPAEERANLEMDVSQVRVDIQINAKKETQTLTINPSLVYLPAGLELINILPENIQLTLQGKSELIEQIFSGQRELKVELDGGDIFTSGRYSLPVQVGELPEGVSLLNTIPNRVSVVVGQ